MGIMAWNRNFVKDFGMELTCQAERFIPQMLEYAYRSRAVGDATIKISGFLLLFKFL